MRTRSLLPALTALALLAGVVPAQAHAQEVEHRIPSVAAALVDDDGDSRIAVVDDVGSTRFLTDGGVDVAPVVSPDGSRIAFTRLAALGAEEGELSLVDVGSGFLQRTGIPVRVSTPILWEVEESIVATTADGVIRISPEFRSVEFLAGTREGDVAHDVVPGPGGEIDALALVGRPLRGEDGRLQLLELPVARLADPTPLVRWTAPANGRSRIDTAAYGPDGSIAFLSTISSIGFGTFQYPAFIDPRGTVTEQEGIYGGDGPITLMSGPFWRPDGSEVLVAGAGLTRFPGDEVEPPTLLGIAPGRAEDRVLTTRAESVGLTALGWTPDGRAAVAVVDDPEAEGAALLVLGDGEADAVPLPGRLAPPVDGSRFGTPDAALLPPVRRVAGLTRVFTAAEVARQTFPADLDRPGPLAVHVVLARADDYADALTGAPLARHLEAPLLLTGSDALDGATAQEIERLGATAAVLLGGPAALRPQVVADLERLGLTVDRVSGPDRFATAAAVAGRLPVPDEVLLVQGIDADPTRGWPDAIAAAPLAAAGVLPLLLTTTEGLPSVTAAALADLDPRTVIVVGGTAAVSEATATAAGQAASAAVTRLAGRTRVQTAIAVAQLQVERGTGSTASLWFATSANWPDALTAGPAVAADGGVLLLVPPGVGDPALDEAVAASGADLIRLVGGPRALSGAQLDRLRALAFGG